MSIFLKPKTLHRGHFLSFEVHGLQHENEQSGKLTWHVTVVDDNTGQINDYWVDGNELHSLSVHYAVPGTGGNLIQNFRIVPDVKERERKAIFDAIANWTDQR